MGIPWAGWETQGSPPQPWKRGVGLYPHEAESEASHCAYSQGSRLPGASSVARETSSTHWLHQGTAPSCKPCLPAAPRLTERPAGASSGSSAPAHHVPCPAPAVPSTHFSQEASDPPLSSLASQCPSPAPVCAIRVCWYSGPLPGLGTTEEDQATPAGHDLGPQWERCPRKTWRERRRGARRPASTRHRCVLGT